MEMLLLSRRMAFVDDEPELVAPRREPFVISRNVPSVCCVNDPFGDYSHMLTERCFSLRMIR